MHPFFTSKVANTSLVNKLCGDHSIKEVNSSKDLTNKFDSNQIMVDSKHN